MNKRQKKKRALASQVAFLLAENILLKDSIKRLNQRVECQESIHSQNVQAINARFEELESENKQLRLDLEAAIAEFKKPKKKSFFNR